jgi:dihydrolipoamide dehydrogenase
VRFDLEKVVARSRAVAKRLSGGVKHLMKKNGIPVFDGRGRLVGPGRVAVEREGADSVQLTAARVVLPPSPPPHASGLERMLSASNLQRSHGPESPPASLLVVGSAIGVEFAGYRDLGPR